MTLYRPGQGVELRQEGSDLRESRMLIGTGGILVHDPHGRDTLASALERREERSLVPTNPRILLDSQYVLAAAGLLVDHDPNAAAALLEAHVLGG